MIMVEQAELALRDQILAQQAATVHLP